MDRLKCIVKGCDRPVVKHKGYKTGYEKTCYLHKLDGSYREIQVCRCDTKKWREDSWKRQGIDMDVEQYNELFAKQKGCCAICGKHQSELVKKLEVDHNHQTGKVRELLCTRCNMLVMRTEFPEKPLILAYLTKHNPL